MPKSIGNYENIMLGTSETRSISICHIDPAYLIEDCRKSFKKVFSPLWHINTTVPLSCASWSFHPWLHFLAKRSRKLLTSIDDATEKMQLFPQYMSQTKLAGGPLYCSTVPTRKYKTPLTKPKGEPYGMVQDTSDKFRPA